MNGSDDVDELWQDERYRAGYRAGLARAIVLGE